MRKATILIQDNIDQTYIDLDDILYVHVQKNYTYIHRTDGSESVHLVTLKDVMDKIDAVSDYSISKFMRLGRSHIVNTAYVSKVEIKRRCITLQCNGRTIELKIYFQDRSAILASPPSPSERSGEGEGGDA